MTTNSSNVSDSVNQCSNVFSKASVYYTELHGNVVEIVFISMCVPVAGFAVIKVRYNTSDLQNDNVVELVFIGICVALSVVSVALYTMEFSSKRHRYPDPGKRLKTLILLGIYPMTSFLASFSLLVPRSTVLLDLLASCYLSLCIYVFMSILIQYFGGVNAMLDILGQDKVSIRTPPCCCCCCCFPQVQLTRRNLYIIKGLIVQVAVIQPFLLFINAVVWADDATKFAQGGPASPSMYVGILSAVTTLLGLYGLQISVRASQIMLDKHRIKAKYSLLQLVMLFSNLQKAIFDIFSRYNMPPCYKTYGSRVRGSVYHHMMLTAEMLMLAVIARYVYRKSESRKLSMTHVTQVKQKKLQKEYSAVNTDDSYTRNSIQVSETFDDLPADEQKNGTSPPVENQESNGTSNHHL